MVETARSKFENFQIKMSDNNVEIDIHEGELVESPERADTPPRDPLGEFLEEVADDEDHSQQPVHLDAEDNFLSQLAEAVVDKEGPSVSGPVAKLVGNHLNRNFRGRKSSDKAIQANDLIDKLSTIPVPANLSELRTCKVNEGVYKAMPYGAKRLNAELQLVESSICKSLTSQALAVDALLQIKAEAPAELRPKFNEAFTHFANAIECEAFARYKTNDARRGQILAGLNEDYKFLSSETKPENGLLFGSNLESAMKSVESANRSSRKL